MSNIVYDGQYHITLSNNNIGSSVGAFAGNGKIALYNSLARIGTHQVLISTEI